MSNYKDSFDIKKTKLPEYLKKIPIKNIDNFHLKFNKFARFEDDEKFKFFDKEKSFEIKPDFSKINFPSIVNRQKSILDKLDIEYKMSNFSPDWRLIVGLGTESVYETSITLHHIYGIPYIPGQSIKGVVRSWIIMNEFNNVEGKKNEGALGDKGFCKIFGSPKDSAIGEYQGSVIFFDAFPTKVPKITIDIMNPHYGDYYSEKKDSHGKPIPPADYLSPKPIFFLTVQDTPFKFYIGTKKDETISEGKFKDKTLLNITSEWLEKALTEHGIGAKTAVGYGYFSKMK